MTLSLRDAVHAEWVKGVEQPQEIADLDWLWFKMYAQFEDATLSVLGDYAGQSGMTIRRKLEHILWLLNPQADYTSHWWAQWLDGRSNPPKPTKKPKVR